MVRQNLRGVKTGRRSPRHRGPFCTAVLSKPEIFNTDQGSQFTSTDFIKVLAAREIRTACLSVIASNHLPETDGKGPRCDNVFVERLWPTIKYEDVYLRAYASVTEPGPGLVDI